MSAKEREKEKEDFFLAGLATQAQTTTARRSMPRVYGTYTELSQHEK